MFLHSLQPLHFKLQEQNSEPEQRFIDVEGAMIHADF